MMSCRHLQHSARPTDPAIAHLANGIPPRRAIGQTFITTMEDGWLVVGTVELKGRRLLLAANLPARAERGRAMLEPVLNRATEYRDDVFLPVRLPGFRRRRCHG
jgi:hypothetical protein